MLIIGKMCGENVDGVYPKVALCITSDRLKCCMDIVGVKQCVVK